MEIQYVASIRGGIALVQTMHFCSEVMFVNMTVVLK